MSINSDEMFYMQNRGSFCGNAPLWWKPEGKGYTHNIQEAGLFTQSRAVGQNKCREEDIPWPKRYIDSLPVQNDMQYMRIKDALKGSGIKLHKEKPQPGPKYKCDKCGKFCRQVGYYESSCCSDGTTEIKINTPHGH